MKKHSRTPAGRLKELYERLERISERLTNEGETYETLSTQGDNVKKLNPLWTVYKDIESEIRLVETEEGKTALGKQRKRKLSAEAQKVEAEAAQIGEAKQDELQDFLDS
ncbi:TPA: hypothetical protein NJ081_004581 [Vibrio parahaemolyticus]|nr:hypothetical protein [Vibrio parahaemolyticus]